MNGKMKPNAAITDNAVMVSGKIIPESMVSSSLTKSFTASIAFVNPTGSTVDCLL